LPKNLNPDILPHVMKKDIHPQLYKDTKVTCACGNTFVTMSTVPEISVDICSMCHPFFTGQQKFIDTEGRIQKFQKKMAAAKQAPAASKKKKGKKSDKSTKSTSLKEMLTEARAGQ